MFSSEMFIAPQNAIDDIMENIKRQASVPAIVKGTRTTGELEEYERVRQDMFEKQSSSMILSEDNLQSWIPTCFQVNNGDTDQTKNVKTFALSFRNGERSDITSLDRASAIKIAIYLSQRVRELMANKVVDSSHINIMWLGFGNGEELLYMLSYMYLYEPAVLERLTIIAYEKNPDLVMRLSGKLNALRKIISKDSMYFTDNTIYLLTGDYNYAIHPLSLIENGIRFIYCYDSANYNTTGNFGLQLHTSMLYVELYRRRLMQQDTLQQLVSDLDRLPSDHERRRPLWTTDTDNRSTSGGRTKKTKLKPTSGNGEEENGSDGHGMQVVQGTPEREENGSDGHGMQVVQGTPEQDENGSDGHGMQVGQGTQEQEENGSDGHQVHTICLITCDIATANKALMVGEYNLTIPLLAKKTICAVRDDDETPISLKQVIEYTPSRPDNSFVTTLFHANGIPPPGITNNYWPYDTNDSNSISSSPESSRRRRRQHNGVEERSSGRKVRRTNGSDRQLTSSNRGQKQNDDNNDDNDGNDDDDDDEDNHNSQDSSYADEDGGDEDHDDDTDVSYESEEVEEQMELLVVVSYGAIHSKSINDMLARAGVMADSTTFNGVRKLYTTFRQKVRDDQDHNTIALPSRDICRGEPCTYGQDSKCQYCHPTWEGSVKKNSHDENDDIYDDNVVHMVLWVLTWMFGYKRNGVHLLVMDHIIKLKLIKCEKKRNTLSSMGNKVLRGANQKKGDDDSNSNSSSSSSSRISSNIGSSSTTLTEGEYLDFLFETAMAERSELMEARGD
jgi:hypothetical protein